MHLEPEDCIRPRLNTYLLAHPWECKRPFFVARNSFRRAPKNWGAAISPELIPFSTLGCYTSGVATGYDSHT